MKLLQTFKKLKRLSLKRLNGKSAALFLLNRKIPAMAGGKANFGAITDLQLDRTGKTLSFEITRNTMTNTITVRGYRIDARKGQSCLGWQAMEFVGPDKEHYRRAFTGIERIQVPKASIFMLEAVL